jgi:hypothetical protein
MNEISIVLVRKESQYENKDQVLHAPYSLEHGKSEPLKIFQLVSLTTRQAIGSGKINYALAATSLTRKACADIQSKAIDASLSKCSFSQKSARAWVFGSAWFGGLGWRHIFFQRGILHVMLVIKHLRTPGPCKSLPQISLQWYQIVTSISFSPLSLPSIHLSYLDSPWLDSTCQFLCHCWARLKISDNPLPPLQWNNDACIMDIMLALNLSPTMMK